VTRGTDTLVKNRTIRSGSYWPRCASVREGWHSKEAAMNYSYWRTERLIRDAVDRRILKETPVWGPIVSVLTGSDLVALSLICIVGLLASFVVLLAYPSFAEVIETLQLF
jgi:hypothetical protein